MPACGTLDGMERRWCVVSGGGAGDTWRGVVERLPGESDAMVLAGCGGRHIVSEHATEGEAVIAFVAWLRQPVMSS